MVRTAKEIIDHFDTFKNGYVYWYGGKNQLCTEYLLSMLAKLYPNVYTKSYIDRCRKDIENGKMCIDCSGLVCECYEIQMMNSYTISKTFKQANIVKNGMILYKPGHVGIYKDGYVLEARSQEYDITDSRKYRKSDWEKILYDPKIDYDDPTDIGWHYDPEGVWYRHTKGTGAKTYYHSGYHVVEGKKYLFDHEGYICQRIKEV